MGDMQDAPLLPQHIPQQSPPNDTYILFRTHTHQSFILHPHPYSILLISFSNHCSFSHKHKEELDTQGGLSSQTPSAIAISRDFHCYTSFSSDFIPFRHHASIQHSPSSTTRDSDRRDSRSTSILHSSPELFLLPSKWYLQRPRQHHSLSKFSQHCSQQLHHLTDAFPRLLSRPQTLTPALLLPIPYSACHPQPWMRTRHPVFQSSPEHHPLLRP